VAVLVEQQAAIEVRALLDRPTAAVLHAAAVEDCAAVLVHRFELDPYVEGIDGAAGEKMPDLPRADDHLDAHGVATAHAGAHLVERRDHLRRGCEIVARGAE